MKRCFKCEQVLPLTEFYRHPQMADGHLNKCKECAKRDVRQYCEENRPLRVAYEHWRAQTPQRRAAAKRYAQTPQGRKAKKRCAQTPKGREVRKRAQIASRAKHPDRYKARTAVGNAVRDGRLIRGSCEVCGSPKTQAHHDDYSKPLDVRWLCFKCHREGAHGQTVHDPLPEVGRE